MVEVVEKTSDVRQNGQPVNVVDEICPDSDYEAKPPEAVKTQYPRNCEDCKKYLRNSLDFRKHVVDCLMSRK